MIFSSLVTLPRMKKKRIYIHNTAIKSRLAVTMLNSRSGAEDALQNVYLKLWDMRSKLAGLLKYR